MVNKELSLCININNTDVCITTWSNSHNIFFTFAYFTNH